MASTSILRSSLKTPMKYDSLSAGNDVIYNDAFEHIVTYTVPADGRGTISFYNIPQNYRHLQVRMTSRDNSSGTAWTQTVLRVNGNSSAIYSGHYLLGDGASLTTSSSTSVDATRWSGANTQASVTANVFASGILDILDYSNTNKNKTFRSIAGYDASGSGIVLFGSSQIASKNAITSIDFFPAVNYVQHTTFALYGIK